MNLATLQKLAKFGSLKVSEITPEVLGDICAAFGLSIDCTDEVVKQVVGALNNDNIDQVADLFNNPATMAKLGQILNCQKHSFEIVRVCPHCGEINSYEVKL